MWDLPNLTPQCPAQSTEIRGWGSGKHAFPEGNVIEGGALPYLLCCRSQLTPSPPKPDQGEILKKTTNCSIKWTYSSGPENEANADVYHQPRATHWLEKLEKI